MTAWDTFYSEVMEEIRRLKNKDSCETPFFRGENNNSNPLLPTLFTSGINLQLEGNLYLDYKVYSATLRKPSFHTNSSWEILYEMRHHNLPTRLLDWSGSFGVALFFAINNKMFDKNESDNPSCIWILDPYKLNKKSIQTNGILNIGDLANYEYSDYLDAQEKQRRGKLKKGVNLFKNPIAIYPIKSHPRLLSQDGYFTIHGTNTQPLEKICKKCLKRIDIPEDALLGAWDYLKHANINPYTLFPDLDGLCRHLTQKYLDETYRLMGLG